MIVCNSACTKASEDHYMPSPEFFLRVRHMKDVCIVNIPNSFHNKADDNSQAYASTQRSDHNSCDFTLDRDKMLNIRIKHNDLSLDN